MMSSPDSVTVLGFAASSLVFATFCMKTMVPLRLVAVCSNLLFLVYASLADLLPIVMLHGLLLPMNLMRAAQMVRLTRRVRGAAAGEPSVDWMRPYAHRQRLGAGTVLFRRGDMADRLYLLVAGTIRLDAAGPRLGPGDLFGEVGLFSASGCRSHTATAEGVVELLWIHETELRLLCFQNPDVAFHLLRLIGATLMRHLTVRGETGTPLRPGP